MSYLGNHDAIGVLNQDNPVLPGGWTVTFGPNVLPPGNFEIYHCALFGPAGKFRVYIDTAFYSASDRGDINEYDPKQPMFVRRGQSVFWHWSTAAGTAPHVWIYLRTPTGETL